MAFRGRTWIRRDDVYLLVVTGGAGVKTFRKTVGFHNLTLREESAEMGKNRRTEFNESRRSESPAPRGGFEPTTLR
jgi:hypothetical protein